jgi:hypothetical protein
MAWKGAVAPLVIIVFLLVRVDFYCIEMSVSVCNTCHMLLLKAH